MADAMTTTSESRDGQGAGDHDMAYMWGRAHDPFRFTPRQEARLLILRGYCMDTSHGGEAVGEARNCATGDLAYTEVLESGLIIPAESST